MIDLLRRIFSQSIQPILYMISEFITLGQFEDPYDEFFVEKLYRQSNLKASLNSHEAQVGLESEDYLFKLTSDTDRIPVFLVDSALTIFKIGCDINLLNTKRKKIVEETRRAYLPDYFAICSQGPLDKDDPGKGLLNQGISRRLSML